MNNYPNIEALPDDRQLRVIWWYGPVLKNNSDSSIPIVLVLTRYLDENFVLSNQVKSYKITVTELELVRIGTIWKGQKRLDSLYNEFENYRNNLQLAFDFTTSEPESVLFSTKIGEGKWLIPPFRYHLGDFGNDYILKKQFYNSTLTKLITTNGITVLIPSLELLTSAIAPEHKLLRAHLLYKPIDQVLASYMRKGYAKDDTYVIESQNGFFTSNLTLLAYMRNNQISRSRLSQIWPSMQTNPSGYSERYPIILPYHPTKLTLKGDGIKIDDTTFLMLRINAFSLPTDYPVLNIMDDPSTDSSQFRSDEFGRNHSRPQNSSSKDNLPITSFNDPHHDTGQHYIQTEVRIIGPKPNIKLYKKNKISNGSPNSIILLDEQETKALSSGEANSRQDSKGTGEAKQAPAETEVNLSNIEWAIKELKELTTDPKSKVSSFVYIGNKGTEHSDQTFCYMSEAEMPPKHARKWYLYDKSKGKNNKDESTKTGLRYRKFLIAKLALKEGGHIYLLEIEQKGTEAFSGLLFSVTSNLTQQSIKELMKSITDNEGHFRKRENGKKGKLIPIELTVDESLIFEHRENAKLGQIISSHIRPVETIAM